MPLKNGSSLRSKWLFRLRGLREPGNTNHNAKTLKIMFKGAATSRHTHKTRKNTSHVSFCLYSVVDSIKVLRHITCQKNPKNNDLSRTNCPLRATQVVQNVRIVQVNHLGIVLEGPSNPKLQLRRLSQKRVGHGEKTHGWTWGSLNHEFVFFFETTSSIRLVETCWNYTKLMWVNSDHVITAKGWAEQIIETTKQYMCYPETSMISKHNACHGHISGLGRPAYPPVIAMGGWPKGTESRTYMNDQLYTNVAHI